MEGEITGIFSECFVPFLLDGLPNIATHFLV